MAQLVRHGRTVVTFFDLLGFLENDMTDSLAFTLSRSPCFLRTLLADLGYSETFSDANVIVSVQTRRPDEGITDLEIQIANSLFAMFEAKRGTGLPTERQLSLYAPVLERHAASTKMLVAVTSATRAFTETGLACIPIRGVTLQHRSWREIRALAIQAHPQERNAAKRLLNQFATYIEELVGMDIRFDNRVFVVALGAGNPDGWSLSWIDIVAKRGRYFYPVGDRWPDPPNYLGSLLAASRRSAAWPKRMTSLSDAPRRAQRTPAISFTPCA
jgi:hypothetical protein